MPSNFNLVLDTIGPGGVTLSIDAGASFSTDAEVILNITTTDVDTTGYQMKVWGDLDGGTVAEGDVAWQAYNNALPVNVSAAEGLKSITIRLRDDVWNESATATDTIVLDLAAPTVDLAITPAKISKIAGKREADVTLTPSEAISEWKLKVVSSTGATEDQGVLIPDTNGSVSFGGASPATPIDAMIDGRDLELAGAEGNNIIKAFVKDNAGRWSVV